MFSTRKKNIELLGLDDLAIAESIERLSTRMSYKGIEKALFALLKNTTEKLQCQPPEYDDYAYSGLTEYELKILDLVLALKKAMSDPKAGQTDSDGYSLRPASPAQKLKLRQRLE